MLALALGAAHATDGLVTPAVGGAIVGRRLRPRLRPLFPPTASAVEPVPVPPRCDRSGCAGAMLLRTTPVVLDLNGVVKGKTVDDALGLRAPAGFPPAATSRPPSRVEVGLPGGELILLDARRARDEQRRASVLAAGRRRCSIT